MTESPSSPLLPATRHTAPRDAPQRCCTMRWTKGPDVQAADKSTSSPSGCPPDLKTRMKHQQLPGLCQINDSIQDVLNSITLASATHSAPRSTDCDDVIRKEKQREGREPPKRFYFFFSRSPTAARCQRICDEARGHDECNAFCHKQWKPPSSTCRRYNAKIFVSDVLSLGVVPLDLRWWAVMGSHV